MKRIVFLVAFLVLVGGCAKQPVIANLNPRISEQSAGVYAEPETVAVIGEDKRMTADVVVYFSDTPPTGLANIRPPREVIADLLTEGLRRQGLRVDEESPVRLTFTVNDLLVKVSRPKLLYNAESRTFITVTVENRGAVLTKNYKREANRETATRPGLPQLEEMLNSQLADILQRILEDDEVRELLARG